MIFQVFGTVNQPEILNNLGDYQTGPGRLLQLAINVMIMAGGIYALFNFILAGYAFLGSADDPKGVATAWAKIYQTIIGLVFLVGSFLLAAIVGLLVFGRADALLSPSLPSVNAPPIP